MSQYKILSKSEFIESQNGDFKVLANDNLTLYKGISSQTALSNYYLAQPSNYVRASKSLLEHGNTYNLLLNNLESWQTFPKREKSIITTSSLRTAKSFGTKLGDKTRNFMKDYVVIPRVNSKIAIAPRSDIWFSFTKGLSLLGLRGVHGKLPKFNEYLTEIFQKLKIVGSGSDDWDDLKSKINQISNLASYKGLSQEATIILQKLLENKGDIFSFIENIFDPFMNEFVFKEYNSLLSSKDYTDNEIWTESDCLLVELEEFKKTVS